MFTIAGVADAFRHFGGSLQRLMVSVGFDQLEISIKRVISLSFGHTSSEPTRFRNISHRFPVVSPQIF